MGPDSGLMKELLERASASLEEWQLEGVVRVNQCPNMCLLTDREYIFSIEWCDYHLCILKFFEEVDDSFCPGDGSVCVNIA